MKKVLVLCTGNSCRSQMAHGYLAKYLSGYADVYSAGVETHGVNPRAIKVMAEDGIDIAGHTSNNVNEYAHIPFDLILTVCDNAKENCPYLPGKGKRVHHTFSDPAKAKGTEEEILNEFRKVRDQVKHFSASLAEEMKREWAVV
jgi:arsenate reductase (thioredoxin)